MYRYSSFEPDFGDDFNYPALNRKDLMSLDTIKEKDYPKKKINQINSKRNWSINLYNLDIDKSYPKKNDTYLNKVDFINKIDDIEKARPTKEKILNKPNFVFNVRDIEKAYPRKERHFRGMNIFDSNKKVEKVEKVENKILTPPPPYTFEKNKNNYYNKVFIKNNNYDDYKEQKEQKEQQLYNYSLKNNKRYAHNHNNDDNVPENNNKYYNGFYNKYFNYDNNSENNKYNDYKNNNNSNNNNRYKYNDYVDNNKNMYEKYEKYEKLNCNNQDKNDNIKKYNDNKKSNLSQSNKNIRTTPLDVHHIIQNQKEYKDTIHDIFNNYPNFIINAKPSNYILNHNHDLIIGTPDKNKRLDVIMDKSNQILPHDFPSKNLFNDYNKKNNKSINTSNSVKINRPIPIEFKNQGLEKLYQELDNYKPRTYEQHLDSFTQNY
jgi:hypothetical protein